MNHESTLLRLRRRARGLMLYFMGWSLLAAWLCISATQTFLKNGRTNTLVPIIDTSTSVLVIGLLAPLVSWGVMRLWAVRCAGGSWARMAAPAVIGVGIFSLIHVTWMETFRFWLYPVFGIEILRWGFVDRMLYEFPKDLISFAVISLVSVGLITWRALRDARLELRKGVPNPLLVRAEGQFHALPRDGILWMEACGNYVQVHTATEKILVRRTLLSLERELDRNLYCRIHRSTLVNVRHVKRIISAGKGDADVELSSGAQLRLSRTYRDHLFSRLQSSPSHP